MPQRRRTRPILPVTDIGVRDMPTPGLRLSDEQRLDWLRLIRSENVGPRGILAQTPLGADHGPDGGNFMSFCVSCRWVG